MRRDLLGISSVREATLVAAMIMVVAAAVWLFTDFSSGSVQAHIVSSPVVTSMRVLNKTPARALGRAALSTEMESASPIVVEVQVPNWNDPESALKGLNRSELRSQYGDPDLAATTVDRGALLETYVYQVTPEKNGPVVLADLKNGKVDRVRTAQ